MKKALLVISISILLLAMLSFLKLKAAGDYRNSCYFLGLYMSIALIAYLFTSVLDKGDKTGQQTGRRWKDFICIGSAASIIFFILPYIIFDDTGFVLRYFSNFYQGYFFRYNIQDAPVYGISGFIHGLYGGTLCMLHLAQPYQAVMISDFTGFVFTAWFVYLILQELVSPKFLAFLVWLMCISCASMYVQVAGSGLETSLHLTFVTGAIYYLIAKNKKLFFLFSALMIISKLDAVPVAGACFVYYFIYVLYPCKITSVWKTEWKPFLLYFIVPLTAGLVFITILFGSPLPQSAYSKLYYHSHPKDSWFPFFKYFTKDLQRVTLLAMAGGLWAINLAGSVWKKDPKQLIHGIFGSLFIASMTLYYFYNPREQMMWYYAMPELFLVMQAVYGTYHVLNTYVDLKYKDLAFICFLALFSNVYWLDLHLSLQRIKKATIVVEGERKRIGAELALLGKPGQILMSGHGLPSYAFKGYVIDISGLNSRLATQYRLNADSLIAAFKPDFMVAHSEKEALQISNRYNYELLHLYRNIALYNYPSWAVLRRSGDSVKHGLLYPDPGLNRTGFKTNQYNLIIQPENDRICIADTAKSYKKFLHIGIPVNDTSYLINYRIMRSGNVLTSGHLNIKAANLPGYCVLDYKIDASQSDSIIFTTPGNKDFSLIQPLYETIGN